MSAFAAACLLWASGAQAWPVDGRLDLEAGQERFQRFAALDWLEVEDAAVATVEQLESGELLLTGKRPGRTKLLLGAQGKVAVWWLRVAPRGGKVEVEEGNLAPVKEKCAGVEAGAEALVANVTTEPCRQALRAYLRSDRYLAREVQVTFEVTALQAQLRELERALEQAGLGKRLSARYVGAGLVLEGKVSPKEHTRALWTVFENSVGGLALDDRMERVEAVVPPRGQDAGWETP